MAEGNQPIPQALPIGILAVNSSKTLYEHYEQARALYGTGAWVVLMFVGLIGATSTLGVSLGGKQSVTVIIVQQPHPTSARAIISMQSFGEQYIAHARINNGVISAWYVLPGGDTGWTSVTNSTVYTGTIYWRRVGDIVTVLSYDNKLTNELTEANIVLCNIGSSNTPSISNFYTRVGNANNADSDSGAYVRVETGGNLRFYKAPSDNWPTTRNISFCATFICG